MAESEARRGEVLGVQNAQARIGELLGGVILVPSMTYTFEFPDSALVTSAKPEVVALFTFYLERLATRAKDLNRWLSNPRRLYFAEQHAEFEALKQYLPDALAALNAAFSSDEIDDWRQAELEKFTAEWQPPAWALEGAEPCP